MLLMAAAASLKDEMSEMPLNAEKLYKCGFETNQLIMIFFDIIAMLNVEITSIQFFFGFKNVYMLFIKIIYFLFFRLQAFYFGFWLFGFSFQVKILGNLYYKTSLHRMKYKTSKMNQILFYLIVQYLTHKYIHTY